MDPRRPLQESNMMEGLATFHLKLYGLWYFLNITRTTGKLSPLFVLACASVFIFALMYVIFQIEFLFTIKLEMKKIVFVYLIVAPCMMDFSKVIFFLTKIREICFIYDTLQVDFLQSIPEYKISAVKKIYRNTARRCNHVCSSACAGLILTGSIWVFVPGYDTDDPTSSRKKVLNGWYPFHYSGSPLYEIIYSYETIMTFWCGGWYCIFECAILMPLVCLCGHFDALSYHIATLKKSDMYQNVSVGLSASRAKENVFLNNQLKYIMKDYEKLIRYSDSIKETYNLVITIILAIEIVNLTLIVLHLIFEDKDAMFILRTCSFMSFQLIEVILICFCSDMMGEASSGIRRALYFNEWYCSDRKMAMTQQLMMIRSSAPLTLTAVKMYPVNLETLLSIFQFIYSTAALLSKKK